MNEIEKLLIEWNKELNEIEAQRLIDIKDSNSIGISHNHGRKIQLISCIEALKNLPNEPKTVSNNEQKKKCEHHITHKGVCAACGESDMSQDSCY